MDASYLDFLQHEFLLGFDQGYAALLPWTPLLMGVLGSLSLGIGLLVVVASAGNLAATFGQLISLALGLSLHLWLSQNIQFMATSLLDFLMFLASHVTGGRFGFEAFRTPSTVFNMGFVLGKPILDFLLRVTRWFTTNPVTMILMLAAFGVIVWAFIRVTKHVFMAVLEFHLAVMVAPILFPWALVQQTATLAEFSISWILGQSLRMFLITVVLGIGVPIINGATMLLTPGGDPSWYSAACLAGISWIFFVLADRVAQKAETVGGRGYALGLSGSALIPGVVGSAMSAAANYATSGVAGAASTAIQGVSRMMNGRRRGA